MGLSFPRFLLDETPWDFARQPVFPSRSEFEAAVFRHLCQIEEYAPEIRPVENWRPKDVVLHCCRVMVRYYCDAPGQQPAWRDAELRSDDGASFTAGELFYKLHNAFIENVRDNSHRYFEGLEFVEIVAGNVPVYRMVPGS
jgi:hypothetical protein